MSIRRVRSLFIVLVVAAAIAKALAELRSKPADVTRHPTLDGGDRPPSPAQDPYQAPVVEPAAIDDDLAPVTPLEAPEPANPLAATTAAAAEPEPIGDRTWVPSENGACPDQYPVKANLTSGIFHRPGQMHYGRTAADRCYPNAQAALDDGLRAAKR